MERTTKREREKEKTVWLLLLYDKFELKIRKNLVLRK